MSKLSSTTWLILGSVVVVVLLIVFAVTRQNSPGRYDAFAQCLTDNGTKVYSAYWCPNCAKQKELFGNSYRLLSDKECAVRGQTKNLTLCQNDGITSVPTWEFSGGERVSGVQSLESLSDRTGCSLSAEALEIAPADEGASSSVGSPLPPGVTIEATDESGVRIEGVSATPVSE